MTSPVPPLPAPRSREWYQYASLVHDILADLLSEGGVAQAAADAAEALALAQDTAARLGSTATVVTVPAGTDPPANTPDGAIIFEV